MSWDTTLLNFSQHFLDLIYPRHCLGCQHQLVLDEKYLCNLCGYDLFLDHIPETTEKEVKNRLEGSNIDHLRFLFWYSKQGLSQELINHIKYYRTPQLGYHLGRILAHRMLQKQYDLIIPIPIAKDKLKIRGYNQSLAIAKGIQAVLQTPIETEYLKKNTNFDSQTKKSRKSRWLNATNMFIRTKAIPEAKKILCIDDVLTSGATMSHCIQQIEPHHQITIATLSVAEEQH